MAWTSVRPQTNDVWAECAANNIAPNNNGIFNAWVSNDWGIIVYDSKSGAGTPDRNFLLVSPNLSNKYLSRLLTLVRQKQMTCGFTVREARAYQAVYVIDPQQDFLDAALAPLVLDGTTVTRVVGDTPAELAQQLKNLLP
ncbi:MAG: hypothetical protein KC443_12985 [Anaerolineales bacterium]|nr:hypothetical protein [Anaerolineales bacterium]